MDTSNVVTSVFLLQWPSLGYVAVILTCNKNKALVKSHGVRANHMLYECSKHQSTEIMHWAITQPFLIAEEENALPQKKF